MKEKNKKSNAQERVREETFRVIYEIRKVLAFEGVLSMSVEKELSNLIPKDTTTV